MTTLVPTNTLMTLVSVCLINIFLTACGSGSEGPSTKNTQDTTQNGGDSFTYKGPAAVSDGVQRFKQHLWENIRQGDRCGGCHSVEGGNTLKFARDDDINAAYRAIVTYIDLNSPEDSDLVTKLNGGHSCWESKSNVCADLLTTWISDWASVESAQVNVVELKPPINKIPAQTKSFPSDSSSFQSLIYTPYLKPYCSGCHRSNVSNAQSPFFASDDIDQAYLAAMSKINLESADISRLVVRLKDESHNCWSDCATNSADLLTAIKDFSATIPVSIVNPDHIISSAMTLLDGIISSSGGRNEDSLIALFEFKTGDDRIAYDTSGVDKTMNLALEGNVEWLGGWGINIVDGYAKADSGDSEKLSRLISETGEYSIEAWVAPNNVSQEGPARIVNYAGGEDKRNFMLGQTQYSYNFLHRHSQSNPNGDIALSTNDDDEVLQATLQHVVVTYNSAVGRKIYVNNELMTQESDLTEGQAAGNMNDWQNNYAFILGREVGVNEGQFKGVIRLVAIYNKAISESQIHKNFDTGVGQRYYVMFNVSVQTGINQAYVVFEVSQFDNYAYLFNKPFFISLDKTAQYSGVALEGIHIGINGHRASSGQAFNRIKTSLDSSTADENGRQELSSLGTVIAQEKGAALDEFYLVFDRLAANSFVIDDEMPTAPSNSYDEAEQSDIGIKTFDEINLTMSTVTGVSPTHSEVFATFTKLKQQLPTVSDINTFLSAQQIGITQLAIEYCTALVDDGGGASLFFPGLDLNNGNSLVLNDRDLLIDPLINKVVINTVDTVALNSEPTNLEIKTELNKLIDKLVVCETDSSCASTQAALVSKAVCATVLASAITVFQ